MINSLILENLVFIQNICFLTVINRDSFIHFKNENHTVTRRAGKTLSIITTQWIIIAHPTLKQLQNFKNLGYLLEIKEQIQFYLLL